MKLDLLTIGDATIDTFLFISDAHVSCAINRETCQICVNYADKLPVERYERVVAGNAANNAVGSARLGLNAAFVASVGADASGRWIKDELQKEGVGCKFLTLDKKTETNASTVLSFQGERTIFVYHAPRKYALPAKLPAARFVYYTSVGEKHERLNRDVASYVKKTGATLGFNPGTYQMRAGLEALRPVLAVCGVLFVNREEAARILGHSGEIKEQLASLHALGPQIVVVTDGPGGSFAYDGATFYHMGIPNTKVVERTGAGDAYATGFMAARAYGASVPEAMCWGTMNSSSVVMYVGPQAGLLKKSQIKGFHKKTKHVCAAEMK